MKLGRLIRKLKGNDNNEINNKFEINSDNSQSKPLNISFLGDSITTFKGWIPPDAKFWYSDDADRGTGVVNVDQTWWHLFLKQTGNKLMTNDSWSGSTVCNTADNGHTDESYRSFINRFDKTMGQGRVMELKPDVIIVFGGTNDSGKNSPTGTVKYNDWTEADLDTFGGAFSKLMSDLQYWNPSTKIINIQSDLLKPGYSVIMEEITSTLGIENVLIPTYSSIGAHPDVGGMKTIANTLMRAVN